MRGGQHAGAVGWTGPLAFAIPSVLRRRNPALFNVARERSEGLAMLRSLWYEAVKYPPTQRVRGPVAQPDRATVS